MTVAVIGIHFFRLGEEADAEEMDRVRHGGDPEHCSTKRQGPNFNGMRRRLGGDIGLHGSRKKLMYMHTCTDHQLRLSDAALIPVALPGRSHVF